MDYCIVYISTATERMHVDELDEIHRRAAQYNAKKHITGMLIYSGQYFIQAIEGNRTRVEALYQRINQDHRHHKCMILLAQNIRKRAFQKWHMGVLDLQGHKELDINLLETLTQTAGSSSEYSGHTALILLKAFRSMLPDPTIKHNHAA